MDLIMSVSKTPVANFSLPDIQASIGELLAAYAHVQTSKAQSLHPLYARLWKIIDKQFHAGGKRLRPFLVILSYQAFGGEQEAAILDVACAWELLHLSMLMHDDIIDRDYIRHGQDNVAGSYFKEYSNVRDSALRLHYANGAALLAGDLVLTSAYSFISNSSFTLAQRQAVTDVLQEAIFTVIGGELLDTEANIVPEIIDQKLIAQTKTASYSLIGPLISGALLAGVSKTALQQLRQLGNILGIGYQLVDDYIGIFGDEASIGKPLNSDLAEGKRSRVITMSLELMSDVDRSRARTLLQAVDIKHVSELRQLIATTNIHEAVDTQLAVYKDEAHAIIEQLTVNPIYQSYFREVVKTLLERDA
jgi:geranylgeranyl pyrophosphate synthase